MPRATIDPQHSEKFELTTLPEGWVELKRMTYRQFLKRRDMAARMTMNFKSKGNREDDSEAVMALANEAIAEFEFKNCIVDHNLEDENGNKLDFRSVQAFEMLDPRVGEEIGSLIDKMNQFDASGNFRPESVRALS